MGDIYQSYAIKTTRQYYRYAIQPSIFDHTAIISR